MKIKLIRGCFKIKKQLLMNIMKTFIFLCCSIVFSMSPINAVSQNSKITIQEDITLTVDEVFDLIMEQTEFSFFYEEGIFYKAPLVELKKGKIKTDELLKHCISNGNLELTLTENNTIIIKQKESEILVEKTKENKISGVVKDRYGEPIIGVSITNTNKESRTFTDINGEFTIVADKGDVIKITHLGYKTLEITLQTLSVLNVLLEENVEELKTVVIGYGKQTKNKVTGAIVSIKSQDISELPVASIEESIAGRMSGVQIVTPGAPGNGSQIKIRGVATITAGRSPLVVVDGYPLTEGSDLNAINPLDIETIDVLKDAASTAIYGSRGANGVILVTTKKAKSNKTVFAFDAYTGFQEVLNPMKFLNAYQYAQMVKEARDWGYVSDDPANRSENDDNETRLANGASPRNIIPTNLQKYLDGTPGLTDNNWLDDIFQKGKINSYNLSASGKNEKTNWFVSGGYFNQEGLIIGSDFERATVRVNLETKFNNFIKLGVNLSPSFSKQKSVVEGWTDSPLQQAILAEPFFTPYNDNGELNISQQIKWHNNGGTDGALVENPVAIALQKKDEKSKFRLFGSTFLELNLLQGLVFKTLFGGDFDYSLREQFRPSTIGAYRLDVSASVPSASERTRVRRNWVSENILSYKKHFNNHNLSLLGGYSYQKEYYDETIVDASLLNNNDIPNIAGATTTVSTKSISEWILISYFGRLQYDFKAKYLFSASLRKDGSSRFGANNKFGTFSSLSGGWIASKEDFFPQDIVVSHLKFRYSWGETGNNQIPNYGSTAVLAPLNGIINDELVNGQRPSTSPNSNLSWETSITNNIGVDLGLFNNKLNLNVDYFVSKTKDMLLEVPVPQQSGFSSSLQNVGSIENKGLEIVLSTSDINLGQVKWNSSFNFSTVKNKVTSLPSGDEGQIISGGTNITKVGKSIGDFYGYKVDGIYKTQEEIDNSAQSGTSVKVGDWRIVDVDKNDVIDDNDRTVIGSPLPDFTYGLNNRFAFKNIDLNVFIDGVKGNSVLSRTVRNATNGQGFSNQLAWYFENRWHPENNPNGTLARPDYTQSSERGRANVSSAFLQDGSFLRIRNITIGYNMPKELLSMLSLAKMRLYVTAKNLFMFTKFKGYNPEQSNSNPLDPSDTEGSYPLNKTFVIGLNVSF